MELMIKRMVAHPQYKTVLTKLNYESIIKASALHDIGKIGISDNILLKPGKLTDEEFEIMKTHTTIGNSIISMILETLGDNALYLSHALDICYYHHERWDGHGYPTGLVADNIPLSARLLSIVDVYDALVNIRVYKPPFSHDEAINIIVEGSGKQFDPDLVDIFLTLKDDIAALEKSLQD
jgi:putative two-component system response regulator